MLFLIYIYFNIIIDYLFLNLHVDKTSIYLYLKQSHTIKIRNNVGRKPLKNIQITTLRTCTITIRMPN